MDEKTLHKHLLSYEGARLDYPFGEDVGVYKVDDKIFAIVAEGKVPVQVSLKCDPELAKVLREKYESVMPGYHLNKQHWNTIVLTGQLNEQGVVDLIRHSYELVTKTSR